MFPRIKKLLHLKHNNTTLLSSSSPQASSHGKAVRPAFTLEKPFPFLSLPPEIRLQIYSVLLIPDSGVVDLLETLDISSKSQTRFIQQDTLIETNILLASKQTYAEASAILYRQTELHLRCDRLLSLPFPGWPVQGVRPPTQYTHEKGSKLPAGFLRRFRIIRLTFFVGGLETIEWDPRPTHHKFGYTPSQMIDGLGGLKDVLRVLAVASIYGEDAEHPTYVLRKETEFLHLDLVWPEDMKRTDTDMFKEHWEKEGMWACLKLVANFRTIKFCGIWCDKKIWKERTLICSKNIGRKRVCGLT
ncbi:hypothetical protein MMC28_007825 [Mycoblastus sanguinarius]|nr:hypothetical protein [Mycoblastus sanguinarius]